MNENVQIIIHSTQHDLSNETMETTYTGKYRRLSDKHLITYDEYFEDEGVPPTKNTNLIKIDENSVQITKKGIITTQMHFENGKKHLGVYQTPFGSFNMMLQTKTLTIDETEHAILAMINYVLYLDGRRVSEYTIQMEISFL